MALYYALGFTHSEIAEKVSYSYENIKLLLTREDLQVLVVEYRDKFAKQTIDNVQQMLMADSANTFARLKELRDQKDELNIALGAAKELFSRQLPLKTQTENTHLVHLIIDRKEDARIKDILAEAIEPLTIDATPTPLRHPDHESISADAPDSGDGGGAALDPTDGPVSG